MRNGPTPLTWSYSLEPGPDFVAHDGDQRASHTLSYFKFAVMRPITSLYQSQTRKAGKERTIAKKIQSNICGMSEAFPLTASAVYRSQYANVPS